MGSLKSIPSVEQVLQTEAALSLSAEFGRPLTTDAIRLALEELRKHIVAEPESFSPAVDNILARAQAHLSVWTDTGPRPVINATGVILHTNLGRAPVSKATLYAMAMAAGNYSNLEMDLRTGKRGDRYLGAEVALKKLTGADAALVVNNNAAAVLLVLSALASRKRVIIARSQLVEIGGGFRMPEVMKQSGARLLEVGTTNRVRLADYEEQFSSASLVLRAHRSNFKMVGFVDEPDFGAVVKAAHKAGLIVVDDLGSGSLLDTALYGLPHEPTVQESHGAGADVICFSADKLLGGPQAGIIVGNADFLNRIGRHPLARALRADKISLAGVTATLAHYLRDEAEHEIPVWKMISMSPERTRVRAQSWAHELGTGTVQISESTPGGGSLPGESMSSYVLVLEVGSAEALMRFLRKQDPPIIARAEKGHVLFDPRTVFADQDQELISGIRQARKDAQ